MASAGLQLRTALACRPRKATPEPKARGRRAAASSDGSDDDSGSEYEPAAEEAAAAAADEAVVDLTQATDSDGDADGAAGGQVSCATSRYFVEITAHVQFYICVPARLRCHPALAPLVSTSWWVSQHEEQVRYERSPVRRRLRRMTWVVSLLTMMRLMMRRYPSLPGGEVRIRSKPLVQTQKVCWLKPLTHAAAAAAAAKARRRKREPLEADPHGPKINEGEEEFDPESLVVSKVRPPMLRHARMAELSLRAPWNLFKDTQAPVSLPRRSLCLCACVPYRVLTLCIGS